ncbi:hypothetical protein A6U98_01445 [Rhizobium sp. WYCCWR10014]|nr:hypothetical protein A6U98_01445 [Rhizobium sp. WYCCWR10014]
MYLLTLTFFSPPVALVPFDAILDVHPGWRRPNRVFDAILLEGLRTSLRRIAADDVLIEIAVQAAAEA